MPPHCDTLDGPVVKAARAALAAGNVDLVLPYVHKDGEGEVRHVFQRVMEARKAGGTARDVADLYFFETVVRIHRAGEGAAYTGLKPAGLSEGPVIPVAERAIETGSSGELEELLAEAVRKAIHDRFTHLEHLKRHANDGVDRARDYVEAMLGLEVYSHHLHEAILADAHQGHGHHHG
jgi:hypothetical protein